MVNPDDSEASAGLSRPAKPKSRRSQATQFFLRGLAISLPSILTLVILLWIAGGVYDYIIEPITTSVRFTIAQVIERSQSPDGLERPYERPPIEFCDKNYRIRESFREQFEEKKQQFKQEYRREVDEGLSPDFTASERLASWLQLNEENVFVLMGDQAVPYADYVEVAQRLSPAEMPTTAIGIYMELVTARYFQSLFNLSAIAIVIAVILLYFLGRLVTARLGSWTVHKLETGILARLPIISNVYSSVKQVTDFLFTERAVEYSRVVAIEYPRRGIWSLGLVTGDSMLEVTAASGEPMVSVLIPSSPMPVTGYTMSVPRSEVLDLNITVDQAFQFCISCGVLVPPQQKVTADQLQQALAQRLAGAKPPISHSDDKLAVQESGEQAREDGRKEPEAPQ